MNTIRLELHKMTEAEVFTWHKFEATGFSARQLSTVLAQLVCRMTCQMVLEDRFGVQHVISGECRRVEE